jgi:uncharacterized protein
VISRREFLEFMAKVTALMTAGCATHVVPKEARSPSFQPVADTATDAIVLAEGFHYNVLARFGDPIDFRNTVGFANGALAFVPLHDLRSGDGLLFISEKSGATILHLRSEASEWKLVRNSPYSRHLTDSGHGASVTPWRTILSAQETDGSVLETDLLTGKAKKIMAMGRLKRVRLASSVTPDDEPVIYSLDESGLVFKFVADKTDALDAGQNFVADLEKGIWIPVNLEKAKFKTSVKPSANLQDLAVDPKTGELFLSLSESERFSKGAILKLIESDGQSGFVLQPELLGEGETGLVCPSAITFDPNGNIWVCSAHSTNSIYVVLRAGPKKGLSTKVGTAPLGTKFNGLTFSFDGNTLFLSVQPLSDGDFKRDTQVAKNSFTLALAGASLRALSSKS